MFTIKIKNKIPPKPLVLTSEMVEVLKIMKGDRGPQGPQGIQGEKGDNTPIKGVDYFTETEKAEMLVSLQAQVVQHTPLFASKIEECEDTSKVYLLPDGYLYAYMRAEESLRIYEKAGGYYVENLQWLEDTNYISTYTDMVAVTPGDIFSYTGYAEWNPISVQWFDENKNPVSADRFNNGSSGRTTVNVTVPDGIAYAQFFSIRYTWETGDVALKVLWVYRQGAAMEWLNTGHPFIPADYEERILALENNTADLQVKLDKAATQIASLLKDKKIVYDGDSICYGTGYYGGYGKLIADRTGCICANMAAGGARLCTQQGSDDEFHSIVDNLPNLPTDGDIYCFQGGINDFWTNTSLGSFDYTNFDGELDTTTACGALEAIFRYAQDNFAGKAVCFVITHKIQQTAYIKNPLGDTFEDWRNAMVAICRKYSVPYYDAFSESGLNGWSETHNAYYFTDADGCHPNEAAYRKYYVPQLTALFERILPAE